MYARPNYRVLLACCQTRSHQKWQFALEGKNEETETLDSLRVTGEVWSAARACIVGPIGQDSVWEAVLYHDYKWTRVFVETLQVQTLVFVPAHSSSRHFARPDAIGHLALHTFVVRGLKGVVMSLDALSMEEVWLTSALTKHYTGDLCFLSIA